MSTFKPWCPKCGGSSTLRVETDNPGGPGAVFLRCNCGYFLYGKDSIQHIFSSQSKQFLDTALADEQARNKAELEEVQRLLALPTCSWNSCDKGASGVPATARDKSKYCSRDCSNKNARHQFKLRSSAA